MKLGTLREFGHEALQSIDLTPRPKPSTFAERTGRAFSPTLIATAWGALVLHDDTSTSLLELIVLVTVVAALSELPRIAAVLLVALIIGRAAHGDPPVAYLIGALVCLSATLVVSGVEGWRQRKTAPRGLRRTESAARWVLERDSRGGLADLVVGVAAVAVVYAANRVLHLSETVLGGRDVGGRLLVAVVLQAALVGFIRRSARSAADSDAAAAAAAAGERLRIARELHDIVGHRLSGVVVQAQVGGAMVDDRPDLARSSFGTIEREGRGALDELRVLLGALREEEVREPALDAEVKAPQPTFDRAAIEALAAVADGAGRTDTTVRVQGDLGRLGGALALQAQRIVQEALANARRHAAGSPRELEVVVGRSTLELRVSNGPGGRDAGTGAGVGVVGMRERAMLLGGALEAGSDGRGGWVVRAELPLSHPGG